MPLFKDGQFVPDVWRRLDASEELPTNGHILMTLEDWHVRAPQRAHGHASNVAFGLLLDPDDSLEEIAAELPHIDMIALTFPKFSDGRAYSQAQLLRTRWKYKGDLRAVGDVLFDQLQLMARSGFTTFEIQNEATIKLLEAGRRPDVHEFYQPSLGPDEVPAGTRPWLRRPG
jgi:uncharacterized protein (DUF934 family)